MASDYMEFILHEEEHGWWAECPTIRYSATAESKEGVMDMCREGVEFLTGRPASECTIIWKVAPPENP